MEVIEVYGIFLHNYAYSKSAVADHPHKWTIPYIDRLIWVPSYLPLLSANCLTRPPLQMDQLKSVSWSVDL